MTQSDQNLDTLFNQARASEPQFDDSAFTNAVMQKVAEQATSQQQVKTLNITPRFSLYDALGLGIGLVACFTLIDAGNLISVVGSIMPDKLVLSPMTIVVASFSMAVVAWGGWLALEGEFKV